MEDDSRGIRGIPYRLNLDFPTLEEPRKEKIFWDIFDDHNFIYECHEKFYPDPRH